MILLLPENIQATHTRTILWGIACIHSGLTMLFRERCPRESLMPGLSSAFSIRKDAVVCLLPHLQHMNVGEQSVEVPRR